MTYLEPQNVTGFIGMLDYGNGVTDGFLMVGILVSLYVIIALFLKNNGEDLPDAMMVAGFVTTITCVLALMTSPPLVNGWHLFMCVMSLVLPAVWSYTSKSA